MTRLAPLPILLLLAASVAAQDPLPEHGGPTDVPPQSILTPENMWPSGSVSEPALTIDVPAGPVAVGEYAWLRVRGATLESITEANVWHWPQQQTSMEVVARLEDGSWTPHILFRADAAGEYGIVISSGGQFATAVVTFGEVEPPPPGKRFVLIVSETERATQKQRDAAEDVAVYCDQKGHLWRNKDPDTVDENGKTPEWLAFYLDEIKAAKVALPAIVIATDDGGDTGEIVTIQPLPDDGEKAVALVKQYGG